MRYGTHEQIICVWVWSADSEELHEIVKLSVYVTADGDRTFLKAVISGIQRQEKRDIPLAAHSTRLEALLLPVVCK